MMNCRCCGKELGIERFIDNAPIHTICIPKHWGKHSKFINATKCKEFGIGTPARLAAEQRFRNKLRGIEND